MTGRISAVIVVLLVVPAGCSSTSFQQPTRESSTTSANTDTPSTTPNPTPTPSTLAANSSSNRAVSTHQYGNLSIYNATDDKLQRVNRTMRNFFHKLPGNKSERLDEIEKVTRRTCNNLTKIDTSVFDNASKAKRELYRVYHAAETINEHYNSRINPTSVQSVISISGEVAKYATVAGAYNEWHEASCAFNRSDPETVEDYYIATAALGFEIAMMQNQIYYKTAFKVTRKASHTRTFRTIQSVFGDDALRIVMSESYWLVHGSLNGLTSFIRDEAQERNLTISNASADREKIRARLEKAYNTSIDPGERLAEAFADSSTEEKIHCSKTVLPKTTRIGLKR